MSFPLSAYIVAALAGFAVTLASMPLWVRWCIKTGHVDDPGHRKIHSKPVALAGGLGVMTGLIVPIIAAAVLIWIGNPSNPFPSTPPASENPNELLGYGMARRALQLCAIFASALGMLWLGWYDDRHELKATVKLVGQVCVACIVAAAGVRITLFVPNLLFSYVITVLWIVTLVNAVNFMDNMNGLCAGISVIGSVYFGILAARAGQYLVGSTAFLAAGAFAGFLPFNFPKAKAFLGDAGSHLAGYILAVLGILPTFYWEQNPSRAAVLAPLLVLALPLIDLARVVVIRTKAGKPFYIGDTNHLSHWLAGKGMSRPMAVVTLWLAAAALGAITLIL